jgi:hypothetical protein
VIQPVAEGIQTLVQLAQAKVHQGEVDAVGHHVIGVKLQRLTQDYGGFGEALLSIKPPYLRTHFLIASLLGRQEAWTCQENPEKYRGNRLPQESPHSSLQEYRFKVST